MRFDLSISTCESYEIDLDELYAWYKETYIVKYPYGIEFLDKDGEVDNDVLLCYAYEAEENSRWRLVDLDLEVVNYEEDEDDEKFIKRYERKNKLKKLKEVSEL
jgi:hypothetical protein